MPAFPGNPHFDFPGLSLKRGQPALVALIQFQPKLFSELPSSPSEGTIAYITDGNTTVPGAIVAGGGSNKEFISYNGTNWVVGLFDSTVLQLEFFTFANLPTSPLDGTIVGITDSTTNLWGDNITIGGGSKKVIASYNGTNWTVGITNLTFHAVWA